MGACKDFCDSKQDVYRDTLEVLKERGGQISLQCEICCQQMSNRKYHRHLDSCHFIAIADSKKQFTVFCLICGFQSLTLKGLERHLKIKHHYLHQQQEKNLKKYQENLDLANHRTIRNKMKEIGQNDINMLEPKDRRQEATFNSQIFQAIVHEKQYKPLQYSKDLAKGDLIYRYAFTQYPLCKYYSITAQEGEKMILCKGILLVQKQ